MAKMLTTVRGDFRDVLHYCDRAVSKSISASLEDTHEYSVNGVRVAVRVYERYSYLGGNRVSLNLTAVGYDGQVHITAISSGGSQAMFFKINTWGEESFLNTLSTELAKYNG